MFIHNGRVFSDEIIRSHLIGCHSFEVLLSQFLVLHEDFKSELPKGLIVIPDLTIFLFGLGNLHPMSL